MTLCTLIWNKGSLTIWYRVETIPYEFFWFLLIGSTTNVSCFFLKRRSCQLVLALASEFHRLPLIPEVEGLLVLGAQRSLHAITKRNVCYQNGRRNPMNQPAVWIQVKVNHFHRMVIVRKRLRSSLWQKPLQNETVFIFLTCREEAHLYNDIPRNFSCYITKVRQAFRSRNCDTRELVGTLPYNNMFWSAPVTKLGSNLVQFQHF